MSANKQAGARPDSPPSYDQTTAACSASTSTPEKQQPSIESPFNFPTDTAPSYAQAKPIQRPVALPQGQPDAKAPFLSAYPPSLQMYGITAGTWHAFVHTISAFLRASVSDKAVSHAADMARQVGNVPKHFGQATASHARTVGHGIADKARAGNYVGAGFGAISGAISLPVGTAIRAVGAVVQLPFAALNAAATKPKTPRERATAYVGAANKDWFHPRQLHASILDSSELAHLVHATPDAIVRSADENRASGSAAQMDALSQWIAPVIVGDDADCVSLNLATDNTLWLVVTHGVEPVTEGAIKK
ncbi:hypothetical protein PpBr36_03973 [Pyricularia pennisetigena]|uniref:hypothetical protein n=1 Tax=Pyricularia pennisetigena TaxID=1578925 RepID=UPI0011517F09|nr:hypothetical protein PpBr36_03973 [Pyricularia pennisetigena]TLS26918.1 hypothetical protein PpBr36_03973 [Pyricularia pennisetigena]